MIAIAMPECQNVVRVMSVRAGVMPSRQPVYHQQGHERDQRCRETVRTDEAPQGAASKGALHKQRSIGAGATRQANRYSIGYRKPGNHRRGHR